MGGICRRLSGLRQNTSIDALFEHYNTAFRLATLVEQKPLRVSVEGLERRQTLYCE